LEEEVLARKSNDDEIRNMANQIKRSLTEELRDTKKALHDTSHDAIASCGSDISNCSPMKSSRLHLSPRAVVEWDKKVTTAGAECAANITDMTHRLKSVVRDEPTRHAVVDESSTSPRVDVSSPLAKALLGDSHECQSLRSSLLAKIDEQQRGNGLRPSEDDVELYETLRGLFASVRALHEALNREIELRESGAEKLRNSLRDDIGRFTGDVNRSWQAEVRQMWSAIQQLHPAERALSPGWKQLSESSLHRQRDAIVTHCRRTMMRSSTPTRMSRTSSVASVASRSPSPKVVATLGQLRE
jgi:hypothetical protein